MFHRSAVLCALATTFSISIAVAQPPDVPTNIVEPNKPVEDLPLLPMTWEEFLAQSGGLTRLKLKMDNATAPEIADEVRRQTGLDLVPDDQMRGTEDNVARFSVEATGEPFWQAVAQWDRGGRTLHLEREHDKPNQLTLMPWGQTKSGRALMVGPFYLVANTIYRHTTRSFALGPKPNLKAVKPSSSESVSLQASMKIDPKFLPLVTLMSSELESATDDRGRNIEFYQNNSSPHSPNDGRPPQLSLKAPEADAQSVKSIKVQCI